MTARRTSPGAAGRILVFLVVGAMLLVLPAGAWAHATVQGTTPQRGDTVAHAPRQVEFRFDESVEGNFGAVRVFDSAGRRADQGDAFHPGGTGSKLAVHLRSGIPEGTYTATYRVVSADSHIVSGGVVFSIGRPTVAGATVQQLLGRTGSGSVNGVASAAARAVQYAALGVAGGVLLFTLVAWGGALAAVAGGAATWRTASESFLARARTLLLGAALAGTISALAAVVLQGAEAAGVSGWSALQPQVLHEVAGTRFGTVWSIAAACWVLFGALCVPVLAPRHRGAAVLQHASLGAAGLAVREAPRRVARLLVAPMAYLAIVPALSGHASTQAPTGLMFAANVAHVMAMSAWVGGLVALLLAVPAATARLDLGDRTALLAAVLGRFSAIALAAVAVLAATGLVQAYVEIRHLDLVFSTAFGRAVFIKLVLLVGLVALGALNRRRTMPRLRAAAHARRSPGADGVLLRRTLRTEVALLAVVLGVTGGLAGYVPAIAGSRGPYSTTTRIGPQAMQLTLDPARVGANQLHLYLTDPRTGAQLDSAKEVTVAASLPDKGIGDLTEKATKAGPGHYIVPSLVLGVPGAWRVTVAVRVNDFDQYAKHLKVQLR